MALNNVASDFHPGHSEMAWLLLVTVIIRNLFFGYAKLEKQQRIQQFR